MSVSNKKVFTVVIDGNDVVLAVQRPNHKVLDASTLIYNKAHRRAVESGSPVKAKVEQIMRDQNLWDDTKQARYKELMESLWADEKALAKGGIKLSEARELAIRMRRTRYDLRLLISKRNELDATSAEAYAEQVKFSFLVANTVAYEVDGKPFYKDVDDYLNRQDDPAAFPAAQALGALLYNIEDNAEAALPENKFLVKHGYADKKLHLIRKSDGKLVDTQGRLVDAEGRLVNEAGELVDAEGNLLTEDGEYKVEFAEFIDDTVV